MASPWQSRAEARTIPYPGRQRPVFRHADNANLLLSFCWGGQGREAIIRSLLCIIQFTAAYARVFSHVNDASFMPSQLIFINI